jgi:hypothetical protein
MPQFTMCQHRYHGSMRQRASNGAGRPSSVPEAAGTTVVKIRCKASTKPQFLIASGRFA